MKKNTLYIKTGILFLALLSFQFIAAQTEYERIEAEMINSQQEIVSKLTGYTPIKGNKKLKSRYTPSERKLAASFLFDELKNAGLNAMRDTYNVQDSKGVEYSGANIYAEIPSTTGSDEYVILSAHYDTNKGSPGAIHNATGVAIVHYVSTQLLALPRRTKNYIVVFFDHQKQSMMGCRMFAKKLKDEGKNVHSMHRVDYIGWDNDEDRAIEVLTSNLSIESMYRVESPVPVYKRTVATAEGRIFAKLGFETITITAELKTGDNSPYVYQASDTYTTVNFKYLASTSDIVYNVMKSLLSL